MTIQGKATEQHNDAVQAKVVLAYLFSLWMKFQSMTIQLEAVEQHLPELSLIMLIL